MFFTLGESIIRLIAITDIFFGRCKVINTPRILANRVSTSWKVHGINARKPLACSGLRDYYFHAALPDAQNAPAEVSTWPKHHGGWSGNVSLLLRALYQPFLRATLAFGDKTRTRSVKFQHQHQINCPFSCSLCQYFAMRRFSNLVICATFLAARGYVIYAWDTVVSIVLNRSI